MRSLQVPYLGVKIIFEPPDGPCSQVYPLVDLERRKGKPDSVFWNVNPLRSHTISIPVTDGI